MKFNKSKRVTPDFKPQSKPATLLYQVWTGLWAICMLLCQYGCYLWDQNPLKVLSSRQKRLHFVESYGEMMIKPRIREKILDIFLSDTRRRQRLLNWVHRCIGAHTHVHDFSTCWQDGTALCALLESICPGICPSYHLLCGLNRVKNCRLGLKLANKYLYVPMDLISAEEIAIATQSTEPKIIQYVFMVKWASENIKDKWSALHESLIAAKTGRCFAKGSGLKSGIVDKRSKFTILVSDTIGVFNLLVEIRGPNHEYCGERIVSLHQAKALLDKSFDFEAPQSDNIKYLEDCTGNTFVRKKVPNRYDSTSSTCGPIHMDVQSGDEGTFYITFVPLCAGIHTAAVKWQNHHVDNSPFRIKVYKASNVSTKTLKGAREKRIIYDSLSFSSHSNEGLEVPEIHKHDDSDADVSESRSHAGIAKSKAYSKGRQLTVTRRRVLRRIITRNGENIVIEEQISPSLSRQSSINDVSDDDTKHQRSELNDAKTPANADNPSATTGEKSLILSAVPEERQGYKDSDQNGSVGFGISSKYTEFDEHNRLDDKTGGLHYNSEVDCSGDGGSFGNIRAYSVDGQFHDDTNRKSTCIPEQDNRRIASNHNKRSPLSRSVSIHPYQMRATRRTKSDVPPYKHRRSDSCSSEISSDDMQETTEDEKGPFMKVIHSSSLRKACMYLCDKTLTHTTSSTGNPSLSEESFSGAEVERTTKAKLRASRSLPLVLQFWKKDVNSPGAVQGLMRELETVQSERGDWSHDPHVDSHMMRAHDEPVNEYVGIGSSKIETRPASNINSSKISYNSAKTIFTFGTDTKATSIRRSYDPNSEQSSTHNITSQQPSANQRVGLTRQPPVYYNKSSGESETDKTDTSSEKAENVEKDKDRSKTFKSIQNQKKSNEKLLSKSKHDISVLSPKAKVNKTTQVSHQQIIKETEWELIEGVYLLMRRISLKVPYLPITGQNETIPVHNIAEHQPASVDNDINVPNVSVEAFVDTNIADATFNADNRTGAHGDDRAVANNNLHAGHEDRSKHVSVNTWLEQHDRMLGRRVAPERQMTRDTEDSGFDDNPTNFNRQGRFSLPAVLSNNGHMKLHRRTYRGPQIALDPSLVNSNSSHSLSLDGHACGNDADDEQLPFENDQQPSRSTQKRRHRRINRDDSFSFSDSELEERRKRIKRRSYAFCYSNSRADSALPKNEESKRDFRARFLAPNSSPHFSYSSRRMPTILSTETSTESRNDERPRIADTSMMKLAASVKKPVERTMKYKDTYLKSSTSESVESNYNGFGVSKPNRADLLSHLDAFQRLCPTEEESPGENLLQPTKIIHWKDENEFFSCSDNNVISAESESDAQNETNVLVKSKDDVTRSPSPSRQRLVGVSSTFDDSELTTSLVDLCSRIDHSIGYNTSDGDGNVARFGDIVTMETNDENSPMILRLAGAGLRHGIVGENNTFQVWVENPTAGSLTVVVVGPRSHTVSETSVLYTGDNLFEVSYRVTQPGIYKVYVKWGERDATETPYHCDITL